MRRFLLCCAILFAPLLQAGCSGGSHSTALPSLQSSATSTTSAKNSKKRTLDINAFPVEILAYPVDIGAFPVDISAFGVCAQTSSTSGTAYCHAQQNTHITANSSTLLTPSQIPGYHPSDLQNAYGVSGPALTAGSGQTVAVIVAYGPSTSMVESDLGVYRTAFGLPPCTQANGCLHFVDHSKDTGYWNDDNGLPPPFMQAWSIEASLDTEMVSAICPNCNILVVAAQDAQINHLAHAVSAAVKHGATEISNSYSVPEPSDVLNYASYFNTPGIPITAGAGDSGYGPGFPATLPTVVAVGGTSLINQAGSWYSADWSGTGSGCSGYVSKPSWQFDTGCTNRTVNDLAVVADPATGVSAYVTLVGGWGVFGGTSVGAPIVASMYALAGNGSSISNASSLYANALAFAPVTSRPNGNCSVAYLCNGGPGYNGPAGLGTPTGLTGF